MRNLQTITGRIGVIGRVKSSANGNPRYRVTIITDNGAVAVLTAPDSGLGYTVQNFHEGDSVKAQVGEHYGVASLADITKI